MRATTLIATLALTGGILGAGAAFMPAMAQTSGTTATTQANWLTMQQVQTKLEADGYRDFEKIERERNKYEATAIDPQGRRVEVKVDARSSEILEVEIKRDKK